MVERLPNVSFVGGVCAGIAYEYGIPVCLVRTAVAIVCVALLFPTLLYIWEWKVGSSVDYYTPGDYKDRTSLFGLFVD
ncbi:PspC domain-containing protein [Candidatus Kaiserbacteria bacterium]|nr:PspC domain-containing protein [Candidatus Kaiserbacteria bacterium]